MARYRTIKPEFWTSEQVMECSLTARLMFIGMWNFADDAGRMPVSAKSLKAQIFPSDDVSSENILRMLDELSSNGLVKLYRVDSKEYLQITGWRHQRIDKPQPTKCPECPVDFENHSSNTLGTFAPERIEREEKKDAAASATHPKVSPIDPQARYFDRAVEILGPGGRGFAAKLLKAKGGVVSLALSALELADGKSDAREYLGAIIRGREVPANDASRGRAW